MRLGDTEDQASLRDALDAPVHGALHAGARARGRGGERVRPRPVGGAGRDGRAVHDRARARGWRRVDRRRPGRLRGRRPPPRPRPPPPSPRRPLTLPAPSPGSEQNVRIANENVGTWGLGSGDVMAVAPSLRDPAPFVPVADVVLLATGAGWVSGPGRRPGGPVDVARAGGARRGPRPRGGRGHTRRRAPPRRAAPARSRPARRTRARARSTSRSRTPRSGASSAGSSDRSRRSSTASRTTPAAVDAARLLAYDSSDRGIDPAATYRWCAAGRARRRQRRGADPRRVRLHARVRPAAVRPPGAHLGLVARRRDRRLGDRRRGRPRARHRAPARRPRRSGPRCASSSPPTSRPTCTRGCARPGRSTTPASTPALAARGWIGATWAGAGGDPELDALRTAVFAEEAGYAARAGRRPADDGDRGADAPARRHARPARAVRRADPPRRAHDVPRLHRARGGQRRRARSRRGPSATATSG